jgi:3-hydroxyisobutyrate dehydrogenase-like beta-hydroxyacid dehydrogenase
MVIIMVADNSQVEETLAGTNGLLKAVHPDQAPLVAIMSTILPETVKRLASLCAEKMFALWMPLLVERPF